MKIGNLRTHSWLVPRNRKFSSTPHGWATGIHLDDLAKVEKFSSDNCGLERKQKRIMQRFLISFVCSKRTIQYFLFHSFFSFFFSPPLPSPARSFTTFSSARWKHPARYPYFSSHPLYTFNYPSLYTMNGARQTMAARGRRRARAQSRIINVSNPAEAVSTAATVSN